MLFKNVVGDEKKNCRKLCMVFVCVVFFLSEFENFEGCYYFSNGHLKVKLAVEVCELDEASLCGEHALPCGF